jgi:hypothetical protein
LPFTVAVQWAWVGGFDIAAGGGVCGERREKEKRRSEVII